MMWQEKIRQVLPDSLCGISQKIRDEGGRLYLVGGWVRDFLLGNPSTDFDLEIYGLELNQLEEILKEYGRPNLVGKSFGIVHMRIKGHEYDFAFPRTEVKTGSGHKGFTVKSDPALDFKTASLRRDFTINAMGVLLPEGKLEDPHGGQKDLQLRILRHVSGAFSEDPLRALRAVQFAARFEFEIDPLTQKLCAEQPLDELSPERIYGEWQKLLTKAQIPSIGLNFLRKMHLLRFFPELEALINVQQDPEWHPEGDVWDHTLLVVNQAAQLRHHFESPGEKMAYMLGALCHDFGKPGTTVFKDGRWRSPGHEAMGVEPTQQFLTRMTNERALLEQVFAYVREHLKPAHLYKARHEVKPGAIRRLSLKIDIEKLVLLAKADHFGRTTPDALAREFPAGDWLLEQARKLEVFQNRPKPLLTGKFLLSLGMKPGPEMGKMIQESFELQLEGALPTRKDVENWALQKLETS